MPLQHLRTALPLQNTCGLSQHTATTRPHFAAAVQQQELCQPEGWPHEKNDCMTEE